MTPFALSTLFTSPPTPRCCQSSRSFCCFRATSACLMATIRSACAVGPDKPGSTFTSTRSPVSRSLNAIVTAALKFFSPGAMRRIAAVEGTSTWRTSPASVFIVSVLPLMAVIVPPKLAAVCAPAMAAASPAATRSAIDSATHTMVRGTGIFNLLFISHFSTDRSLSAAGRESRFYTGRRTNAPKG